MSHKLPLKKDGSDMYEKMDDGILLCKVIIINLMYNRMVMVIIKNFFMAQHQKYLHTLFHPDHQSCGAGHNRRARDQQRQGGADLQAAREPHSCSQLCKVIPCGKMRLMRAARVGMEN